MAHRSGGVTADLFQALVEHSSDAIALVDENGVVRFASPSSERVLGYGADEWLNRNAFELVHPDDQAPVSAAFARVVEQPGVPVTQEFRVRHKDGSWRHVEAVAVNRLADTAVHGIVVNYRDVSERRIAETALRASEERLRRLFDTAPDIIYYCNPQGRFTYVNPTATRVMKYGVNELIGRHFLTLIHPDHQAAAGEFYARQIAERTPNSYLEFPALAKDGSTVWVGQHVQLVIEGGEVAGVQAICRDISRQKDAEDRLRRSEAQYRSFIESFEHGIFRTSLTGEILDANPAFARMLGYDSVDEVRARRMSDVYASSSDRTAILERYQREKLERLSGTVAWRKKDGSRIIVHLTGRIVDNAFEAMVEDITEKRALEEQLRQSQKMEAVGRLARGIAHDFNNVLAAILGCADLMQMRMQPDDPSYVDAVEIAQAAERGAALTKQLLAFSRRQAARAQVLDVHEVLRGFDSMLQRIAGEITLRLHTPGDPPKVRVEPGQLEQVVMNLVLNARDATPADGSIDVYADTVRLDGHDADGLPDGRYARIAVHDTGSGIDPSLQRNVFEPFFTTKDPSKGNGLGLSIVYGIAKEAGGTVTFSSLPGKGTTFEVFLPLQS